ncbi:venom serine protease Bi-VSP-like isoform X1 [Drosophila eugracilis]|uniref:venom serine protease Bi-VSP-like isoform X1 n=1 Tax=Drosophila eugracilis TaxID=29029 RepID=UPI0007E89DD9|nr:venom serine protease Bi-VSP-like isoform X1 [Drosophila eugracilis]
MNTPSVIFAIFAIILLRQEALAQFLEPNCGLSKTTTKIIHGQSAEPGTNPWLAYIYRTVNQSEPNLVCIGSLIHKEYVLVGAHCIYDGDILTVRLGPYNSLGTFNRSRDYEVKEVFKKKLLPGQEIYNHNIAILKLGQEVQFNDYIQPICLITDSAKVPNVRTFQAASWLGYDMSVSREPKILELNELNATECKKMFWLNSTDNQICAAQPIDDPCVGVPGGPLVQAVNIEGRMRYAQFGVASFGTTKCPSLDVFTRVTSHIEWILKVLQDDSLQNQPIISF